MLTPTSLHKHFPGALRIAVIGAGAAGAMAARMLADHGHAVEIFDKARGAGGRLATRRTDSLQFDHGAQYLTLRDPQLESLRAAWIEAGVLAAWQPHPDPARTRWVGVPGMSALARHLVGDLPAHWTTEIRALHRLQDRWRLSSADGDPHDGFDAVVVAIPAPQARSLLRETARWDDALAAVEMAPCWTVLAAGVELPRQSSAGIAELELAAGTPLAWAAHDAGKPGRDPSAATWVLHADAHWSRAHLEDRRPSVAATLWQSFASLAGASPARPPYLDAHRWRHARVVRPLGRPFLWDAQTRLGVCGDWCLAGRVEAALLSGAALARRIMADAPAPS